ncbi:MAG: filamentous hemagglutinin family protein [Methylococcaceae bacterium]|jgi:filamentous hemagglutinin family protein
MVRKDKKKTFSTHAEDAFSLKPTAAYVRMVIASGLAFSQTMPVHAELPSTAQALANMPFATAGAGIPLPTIAPTDLPVPSAQFVTTGENLGSAETSVNGNTRVINQTGEKVILNYDSFNVGKNATVQFVQPSDVAIALNRVSDVTGNPSQILGRVDANGQVYLVNKNGFVFGENSVVDTHGLVASALDISNEAIAGTGITQQITNANPGSGFLPALSGQTSCFNPSSCIDVKSGAAINIGQGRTGILAAPTVSNAGQISGGKNSQIILVASEDKVYLQTTKDALNTDFQGLLVEVGKGGRVTNSGNLTVRQGNITLAGFTVNQDGRISSTTSVNTNGSIRLLAEEGARAVTPSASRFVLSPNEQGSVRANGDKSTITFGKKSVTEILPDTEGLTSNSSDGVPVDDPATSNINEFLAFTALDNQAQPQSLIQAAAHNIHLEGSDSQGALITAPSATINFTASNFLPSVTNPNASRSSGTSGQIILDKGAKIDVSGTNYVNIPIERNVAEVSIQSINLADSPFQRGGPLQGATVRVDIRKNTTIADVKGAADTIRRGVAERLSGQIIDDPNGRVTGQSGQINFTSSGQVILNSGSTVDISGGAIQYKEGNVNTTRLITPQGRLVDISDADPNVQYAGIFGVVNEFHQKWLGGTPITYNILGPFGGSQFQQGYTQGTVAGSFNIQSPEVIFDGQLIAKVTNGINQRNNPLKGGSLSVDSTVFTAANGNLLAAQNLLFTSSAQALSNENLTTVPTIDNSNRITDLVISSNNLSGVGVITLSTLGKATLDGAIELPVLSDVSVTARSGIEAKGLIHTAGGTVSLTSNFVNGPIESGELTVFNTAKLDVSGRFVNEFQKNLTGTNNEEALLNDQIVINGGEVKLIAGTNLNYDPNASIKVDGGALNSSANRLTAGNGGKISLVAGNFFDLGAFNLIDTSKRDDKNQVSVTVLDQASLALGNNLSAYGLAKDGELTIRSPGLINLISNTNNAEKEALNLTVPSDFGFSRLNVTSGINNISIKENSNLAFITNNRVFNNGYQNLSSADSISVLGQNASRIEVLQDNLKTQETAFNFTALQGLIEFETGSQVIADKQANITILGSLIDIEGKVEAPSGVITITQRAEITNSNFNPALGGVFLGSQSQLLVKGTARLDPVDSLGRAAGQVLDGGKVNITSEQGYIALSKGAQIDVSGTSVRLDLPISESRVSGVQFDKRDVGSDAGEISLTAATGVFLDGSLSAHAGSATNQGGKLTLSIKPGVANDPNFQFFNNSRRYSIDIQQNDSQILPTDFGISSILTAVASNNTNYPTLFGRTIISSEEVGQGGFNSLNVLFPYQGNIGFGGGQFTPSQGEIRFIGDVALNINNLTLDSQTISSGFDNGASAATVTLNTQYLQLGSSSINEVNSSPVLGNGLFQANSDYVQLIGALALNRFNQVDINSQHDLRVRGLNTTRDNISSSETAASTSEFVGELRTAANINLNASQIYPATLSQYKFNLVNNAAGQIAITGQNKDATPLAAAGKLIFSAPTINQNGVLKSPFGVIELDANKSLSFGANSLTSVSGNNNLVPFGEILGTDLVYSLLAINSISTSVQRLVFNNPQATGTNLSLGEKQLLVSSPNIEFTSGSVVDISGGGDLQAVQFVPGAGGSFDYLNPSSTSYSGGFAILPSLNSNLAPYDPYLSGGFNESPLATVHLPAVGNLPAGNYTILPARYALLPGAYYITPRPNTQDQLTTISTQFGLPIVSGYEGVAGTDIRDSRLTGYLVETSTDVKRQSAYDIQTASNFFTQRAENNGTAVPILPADSGRVQIDVANVNNVPERLVLLGEFQSEPGANGRAARLDIAANNIKIVNAISGATSNTELELQDQELASLNVGSILLGGTRKINSATRDTEITVTANNVTFDNGTTVTAPDILAVASGTINVSNGATLESSGVINTGDHNFTFTDNNSNHALLRVSGDSQVSVEDNAGVNNANIVLSEGATLRASGSVLFSAGATDLQGVLDLQGGSLSLSASSINVGELGLNTVNTGTNVLNLSNERLQSIRADELLLTSSNAINFFGEVGQRDSNGNLTPFKYSSLVLDARAFSGFENSGKAAVLQADTISLTNSSSSSEILTSGNDGGELDLIATNFSQQGGNFAINGFDNVNISVTNQFLIAGASDVAVAGNLNLTTGSIIASGGKSLTINAATLDSDSVPIAFHDVTIAGVTGQNQVVSTSFGGGLTVNASRIGLENVNIAFPSGSLNLTAQQGDIKVSGQSNINLAGQAIAFADVIALTPGGTFNATSVTGKVSLEQGTKLDVSVAGRAAAAGNLILKAPQQSIDLSGQVLAAGANVIIDVNDFGNSNFDGLITVLTNAGADGSLSVRARNADIIQLASNITAANINLTADNGIIDIFSQLHADNSQLSIQGVKEDGGVIALNAGGKIFIENSAVLTAQGNNEGGKIALSSTDDVNGGIAVRTGAVLNVNGGAKGGQVLFAAARTKTNGSAIDNEINIEALDGTIIGARAVYAQGVRKYDETNLGNDGDINGDDISDINNDTVAYYAAAANQVANRLASAGAQLSPDTEIDYAGNLTLAAAWDLATLRLNNNIPVTTISIRAQGSLDINAVLEDGFNGNDLLSGTSSTFQVIAGADLNSADQLATRIIDTTNDITVAGASLTIGSNASIHTGSGDITIAAAGDFKLRDETSTVYNAGRRDAVDPFGVYDDVTQNPNQSPLLRLGAEYPIEGGATNIHAGRNIIGAVTAQSFDGYIVRQGIVDLVFDGIGLTTYGIDPNRFQQNVGSFGGGKVNIDAGGNINDLTVVLPNTAKQTGFQTIETISGSDVPVPTNSRLEIQGGGVLQVSAAGNIAGGIYYQGTGIGTITAGGDITGSSSTLANAFTAGPQLLLSGNNLPLVNNIGEINRTNTLSISAGGNIKISGVTDALLLSTVADNFFSYSNSSKVSFQSLGGDITLVKNNQNNASVSKLDFLVSPFTLPVENSAYGIQRTLRDIYPASLDAVAYTGSVKLDSDIVLFPSATSSVNIFARQQIDSVSGTTRYTIAEPDIDPGILSNAIERLTGDTSTQTISGAVRNVQSVQTLLLADDINTANSLPIANNGTVTITSDPNLHALVPLHTLDTEPSRIVTQEGDISNVNFTFSEQAVIRAGRDLINSPIRIQQSGQNQGSLISAGRDISFTTQVNENGVLRATDDQLIQIAGTGEALLSSGRNINLGTSEGIRSIGNSINPSLPSNGANLSFIGGLTNNKPDYVGFLNAYLANNPLYSNQFAQAKTLISEFIRKRSGNTGLAEIDAISEFAALNDDQLGSVQPVLNAIIEQVYFNEIRAAGVASASTGDPTFNQQGYQVINTLFPDEGYKGDLTLFFSQIQTLVGGDINFLLPGGSVNAGLAVNPAGDNNAEGDKTADRLGISVQDIGSINVFVNNNFEVNTSRVFTLNGGDILIWSSFGDIDAGRGPRASLGVSFIDPTSPAPGVNLPRVPVITSGSGIRTSARPGQRQGDVLLFAPGGVVDAGEAGIAGNDVTIVATAVLGANNISVGGVSTGVPTAPTSVVSGLTGTSNSTANTSQAAQQIAGLDEAASSASKNAAIGLLSVDVLSFGE